jgi:protein O-mannosyl-transferase
VTQAESDQQAANFSSRGLSNDERAPRLSSHWKRPGVLVLIVALAAIIMGLPTLRGGFVGGDDHRLALDHVLVNRPSLDHAIKLFTIVHRDLYQPLPLLMFSGEMAIAQALDLFRSGPQGGAWLFHLTNVLLHVLVTMLVWHTVRLLNSRLRNDGSPGSEVSSSAVGTTDTQSLAVATIAALLFAIHPLNVETVAWINGRMMLLSTLFGLCGVLTFARWLDRPRWFDAFLTILFMVLSALSKVRVGLPLLLLLVALMRGDWRRARFWPFWIAAGVITAFFAWLNIGATSQADLFSEAAEHLQGPRAVRVLLALENYFTHVTWPVGLTSYYPTPPVVSWSDPQTLRAILVNAVAACLLALSAWRVPAARWGIAWFFIALADTLPFIPARNVLAADRYMYLPLVGLFWSLAAVGVQFYTRVPPAPTRERAGVRLESNSATSLARKLLTALVLVLILLLIGMSWYTARWYENPELKTERVARVFPNVPRVWERYGWTIYSNGDYDKAIELAQREFAHNIPAVQSGAYQLIGMSRFKQGKMDDALAALQKAIEIDPDNSLAKFRLAMVYEDLGRFSDALPLYEALVASTTSHNPTLHRLARVYRELNRPTDARRMYEQELKNNPYEAPASLALADLDFRAGSPASLQAAEVRLLDLLEWMPENVPARINLAHLYDAVGDANRAAEHYKIAQHYGFDSLDQALFAHDFFDRREQFRLLIDLWNAYFQKYPDDHAARAFLAWSLLNAGEPENSREQIARLGTAARSLTMAQATVALMALEDGRDDMVRSLANRLVTAGDPASRQRLLRALERFDTRKPGLAWTYYLTAALLHADGKPDAARAFLDLFTRNCSGPACSEARGEVEQMLHP